MSELHRFVFEGLPVRGRLVRLTDSWRELLQRRRQRVTDAPAEPDSVRHLLGEMAAASVLMHSNLRFDGALVLQLVGDGPVKLAVAEVQPDLAFRATVTVVGEVPDEARLEALLNVHGKGRCAITLDPRDRRPGQQPYQGVVPLHGDQREPLQDLASVLEHYMLQSEQLDTRLVLAANDELAAGLLIQRMPTTGSGNLEGAASREGRDYAADEDEIGRNESYNRIAHLTASLTRDELLTLDAETLLRRLYWQEPLRHVVPEAEPPVPRFACTCSRERVARMLQSLGQEECDSLIAERGEAEVGCEFCGAQYRFDAVDIGEMFAAPRDQAPGSRALN